jgi:hypothetical protein
MFVPTDAAFIASVQNDIVAKPGRTMAAVILRNRTLLEPSKGRGPGTLLRVPPG